LPLGNPCLPLGNPCLPLGNPRNQSAKKEVHNLMSGRLLESLFLNFLISVTA
jgi:hypothetical protein